jgi:outer membrane receptor protein involved in Fe transport
VKENLTGALIAAAALWAGDTLAQSPGPATSASPSPVTASPAPVTPDAAPADTKKASSPGAATASLQTVEVSGSASDAAQREAFVAGRIVIGRQAIEKSGVSTVKDLLRREPSVTVSANGRLGLLGLPGYTQILVDGVAPPAGRDPMESDLVHIERVEIIKGSVAEHGPFGIAGTINLVTRRTERVASESLRMTAQGGPDSVMGDGAWSLTSVDKQTGTTRSLRASFRDGDTLVRARTRTAVSFAPWGDGDTSTRDERQHQRRTQASLSGNLGWRDSATREFSIDPSLFLLALRNHGDEQYLERPGTPPVDARVATRHVLVNVGLDLTWKERFADGSRLQLRLAPGWMQVRRRGLREDGLATAADLLRETLRQQHARNDHLKLDYTAASPKDHDIKAGLGLGRNAVDHRVDAWLQGQDDPTLTPYFGKVGSARTRRANAFIQDDWRLNAQWALNAGLSADWRDIDQVDGPLRASSRFTVLAPSLNLAWKPADGGRLRARLSLARTARLPDADQLSARPTINPLAPCLPGGPCGGNTPDQADLVGNPSLRPEKAWGLTGSLERYIGKDSTLGVDVFARRIEDLVGSELLLAAVPWSATPRYISRPMNFGKAWSAGMSLDARMKAPEFIDGAPKLELRSGITWARSRVSTVAGPDNRLDGQSPWSGKVGLRWEPAAWPAELSLDINWLPPTWRRADDTRLTRSGRQIDADLQMAWTLSPKTKIRGTINNLLARDRRSDDWFALVGTPNPATLDRSIVTRGDRRFGLTVEMKL